MIPYRKTRIIDIMNEVRNYLQFFINPFNFDNEYLLIQVIQAIRYSEFFLLPHKVWAFKDTIEVTHKSILPTTLVAPIKLTITNDNVEARYVDFREYYQLTNWRYQHSWNRPTQKYPIYTITGLNKNKVIFIAPNNDFQTGVAPPGFNYYNGPQLVGVLEFYSVPNFNSLNENSLFPLPDEFRKIVVLDVSLRVLSKVADREKLLNLHKDLLEIKTNMWNNYVTQLANERKEMDNFVEQVPPFVSPPSSVTGELPNKLV